MSENPFQSVKNFTRMADPVKTFPEAPPVSYTRVGFSHGVRRMVPLALGLSVFGMAYGLAAGQKGLSLIETGLMSALVFAGASQMLAVELWPAPGSGQAVPVFALGLAVRVINLRLLVYSASLGPWLGGIGAGRAYGTLFFTTDESWALSMAEYRAGGRDVGFLLGAGVTLYGIWFAASLVGRAAGVLVADPVAWGLDFVAVAAFIALLLPLWQNKSDLAPWAVAAGVAVLVYDLLPGTSWFLIAGGLAGSLYGAWRDTLLTPQKDSDHGQS